MARLKLKVLKQWYHYFQWYSPSRQHLEYWPAHSTLHVSTKPPWGDVLTNRRSKRKLHTHFSLLWTDSIKHQPSTTRLIQSLVAVPYSVRLNCIASRSVSVVIHHRSCWQAKLDRMFYCSCPESTSWLHWPKVDILVPRSECNSPTPRGVQRDVLLSTTNYQK